MKWSSAAELQRQVTLNSKSSFASVETIFSLWRISSSKKRKVEDTVDINAAAKRALELEYASFFYTDDKDPSLATEGDEEEEAYLIALINCLLVMRVTL